jgi:aminoglycoside 3-N-acetyltransferase I
MFAAFGWPLDDNALAQFLASPTDYLLVAYLDHQLCGVAIAHELRRLDGMAPKLFLYSIDTLPAFQRQGVASALIEELKHIGIEKGARGVFLITNESNAAAMALYRATGGQRRTSDEAMLEYDLKRR